MTNTTFRKSKYTTILTILATLPFLSIAAKAQTFTTLYSFTGEEDGATPISGLALSEDTLYGSTYSGGIGSNGTIFSIQTNGSNFQTLYGFQPSSNNVNISGGNPQGTLTISDNTLYGTATYDGIDKGGTIFSIQTNGSGFQTIHFFNHTDGGIPFSGLILLGNTLYGTACTGGSQEPPPIRRRLAQTKAEA